MKLLQIIVLMVYSYLLPVNVAIGNGGLGVNGNVQQIPVDPIVTGSLPIGSFPFTVYVSGRYAYVVDEGSNDLKIIDVTDPNAPFLTGSLALDESPRSIYVSGRYAYVTDTFSNDLKVIDVSDPGAPALAGSLALAGSPVSVRVSGHYAYVVGDANLKVINVAQPNAPSLAGFLAIGSGPTSVDVSGRYAYVIDNVSNDMKVIDVADPNAPVLAGSVPVGTSPFALYVSGRYAYVVDWGSNDLRVIDVADAGSPVEVGSLVIGSNPFSVFVSGRYAYIADWDSNDLKVIDVSDPASPTLSGSLDLGAGREPYSVFVSGRYAYVVDVDANDLKVIDVSGAEFSSLMAHSLEAGNLQVRNDVITQGQLQVSGGVNVGPGGIFSDGNVGVAGIISISHEHVPTSSPADLVQLYAEDVPLVVLPGSSTELRVRDEAGIVTNLSPHNFSLVGGPSETMAWSFYSENDKGRINVDMLRAIRLVEAITGQKLVFIESKDSEPLETPDNVEELLPGLSLPLTEAMLALARQKEAEIAQLKAANVALEHRLELLEKRLQ